MSIVMPAVEEIILEIVPGEDVLQLRVGQKTIARCRRNHPRDRPRRGHPARAALEDPAFVKFSEVARRHARRRKMRLVDVTRN